MTDAKSRLINLFNENPLTEEQILYLLERFPACTGYTIYLKITNGLGEDWEPADEVDPHGGKEELTPKKYIIKREN